METIEGTTGTPDAEASEPPDEADVVRTIGHDEFDPTGTLTLLVGYFVLLVLLWIYLYFVEFLGNGLTVVG